MEYGDRMYERIAGLQAGLRSRFWSVFICD